MSPEGRQRRAGRGSGRRQVMGKEFPQGKEALGKQEYLAV